METVIIFSTIEKLTIYCRDYIKKYFNNKVKIVNLGYSSSSSDGGGGFDVEKNNQKFSISIGLKGNIFYAFDYAKMPSDEKELIDIPDGVTIEINFNKNEGSLKEALNCLIKFIEGSIDATAYTIDNSYDTTTHN